MPYFGIFWASFGKQPGYNASSGAVPDPRSDFYCGANAGKPSDNTSAAGGNGNYCPVTDNGN